jgi:transcriptional regulator of arginine metabolism
MLPMRMPKHRNTRTLLEEILQSKVCESHADIQRELKAQGISITQASISRALARLGAIKTTLPNGQTAYRLHKGTVLYRSQSPRLTRQAIAHHLAERIIANGTALIVLGKPDSGRYLGTFVDDAALPSVAGTIAGGNTLLILPMAHKNYQKTCADVKMLFPETPFIQNA